MFNCEFSLQLTIIFSEESTMLNKNNGKSAVPTIDLKVYSDRNLWIALALMALMAA